MPGKRTNWSTANIKDYNALYNYLVKIKTFDDIDDHKFDYPSHYGNKLFDIMKTTKDCLTEPRRINIICF